MYSTISSTALLRQLNPRKLRGSFKNVMVIGDCRFYGKYSDYGKRFGVWFREQSVQVAKACTRQCEFIAAQRIRRSLQIFHLYSKIWDEVALREVSKYWRRRVGKNTRELLFSAAGVAMFNWDQERITDSELYSYAGEMEGLYKLREASVICTKCNLRLIIDQKQENVKYCKCHGTKPSFAVVDDGCEWKPFIEREDMLIWRKEEPNTGGLYAYKVFGAFSDVSAEEFLQVQVDVDYRKEWDPTAIELKIIDTDPSSISAKDHRTDVVYWEMKWPRLFSNRDYVYQRRWVLDEEKGIVVIVSRVTDHPSAPNRPDTYRVQSYWSYMVIKPCTSFDEPGIEFSLTYFDDPGVNIPSAVTTWVAMSGLPDFLIRMRHAAKDYKNSECFKSKIALMELSKSSINQEVKESIPEIVESTQSSNNQETLDLEISESNSENESFREFSDVTIISEEIEAENEQEDDDHLEQSPKDEMGYFRYFFLTRLFA